MWKGFILFLALLFPAQAGAVSLEDFQELGLYLQNLEPNHKVVMITYVPKGDLTAYKQGIKGDLFQKVFFDAPNKMIGKAAADEVFKFIDKVKRKGGYHRFLSVLRGTSRTQPNVWRDVIYMGNERVAVCFTHKAYVFFSECKER